MPKPDNRKPPVPVHLELPKYVFREVRSSGNHRLRFIKRGCPKITLPLDIDSPEFARAYEAALRGRREIGASRTLSGTLNELVVSLYKSEFWQRLAQSTRDGHRYRLERLREKHGNTLAHFLDAQHLHAMLAKLTPVNQKNWIKTFRILYDQAIREGLAERDPSRGYKLPKIVSKPHRRWEDEEIAQYEECHPIGTKARLALDLLRYTGMRKSDILRLGPQHVYKDRIKFKTQKTGRYLVLPLDPRLAATIAATKVVGSSTFLVTKHGKPHGAKGFSGYMRKWCNEAGVPDLSAHGIRHTVGAQMTEKGASVSEVMAVLGHSDPRMAVHYSSQANQAKLAESAFAKLQRKDVE